MAADVVADDHFAAVMETTALVPKRTTTSNNQLVTVSHFCSALADFKHKLLSFHGCTNTNSSKSSSSTTPQQQQQQDVCDISSIFEDCNDTASLIKTLTSKSPTYTESDIALLHCIGQIKKEMTVLDNPSGFSEADEKANIERLIAVIDEYQHEIEASTNSIPDKLCKLIADNSSVAIFGDVGHFTNFFRKAIKLRNNVTYIFVGGSPQESKMNALTESMKKSKSKIQHIDVYDLYSVLGSLKSVFLLPYKVFLNSKMLIHSEAQVLAALVNNCSSYGSSLLTNSIYSIFYTHQIVPEMVHSFNEKNLADLRPDATVGRCRLDQQGTFNSKKKSLFQSTSVVGDLHFIHSCITNLSDFVPNDLFAVMTKKYFHNCHTKEMSIFKQQYQ